MTGTLALVMIGICLAPGVLYLLALAAAAVDDHLRGN